MWNWLRKVTVTFIRKFSLQTIRMGADLVEMLRDVIFYLGLMSPACFEDLVLGLNFSNVACIKVLFFTFQGRVWWSPNQMAVSKGLGLGIVVGSSLVKLPQVGHHHWSTNLKSWKPCFVICARHHLLPGCENCKVWQCGGNISHWNPAWACCHHSVRGLQLQSGLPLQVLLSTYNNKMTYIPGSSYGESVFLAAQTSAIGILVIAFTKGKPSALLFCALYAGSLAIVLGFNPVKNTHIRRRLGAAEPPHHSGHHVVVRPGCQHPHDPPRWNPALHILFSLYQSCHARR